MLGAVICCYAVEDHQSDIMTAKCDWELVGEDVILGFKIWGVECEDTVERGRAWMRGEYWMILEELDETIGRQGIFGRDIEGWT